MIDTPTLTDIVRNWQYSDLVMGGTIYGSGILWSYTLSRTFPSLMSRLVVYHGLSHMFFVLGLSFMMTVPYRRLTGFADNGLRWRKPDDKLKKYDNTSEFEKATIWKTLKINNE